MKLLRWSITRRPTLGRVRPAIKAATPGCPPMLRSLDHVAALRLKELMANRGEAIMYPAGTPVTQSALKESMWARAWVAVSVKFPEVVRRAAACSSEGVKTWFTEEGAGRRKLAP